MELQDIIKRNENVNYKLAGTVLIFSKINKLHTPHIYPGINTFC